MSRKKNLKVTQTEVSRTSQYLKLLKRDPSIALRSPNYLVLTQNFNVTYQSLDKHFPSQDRQVTRQFKF